MHFVRLGYNNSDEIMNIELFLSNDEEIGIKNDKFYSIMLGVPCEMSSYEFQTFIEPFIHDIAEFKILICPESETVELNSRCALINFYLEDSCQTFSSLYNNLHFPTHRDSPPCIVIPITHIENIPFSPSSESVLGNRVSKSDHRRLPLCCVCLRRIKSSVSRVNGSNDLPVNTKFTGNGLRCKVCRIYGGSSSIQKDVRNLSLLAPESPVPIPEDSSFSKLRRCLICGLQENIWVCMSCAHTGCGRYTCQHAKNHYDMSGHPFSLELVSGRIWDYDFDTFVHLEKSWYYFIFSPQK
jgi:BRCA1-associated protein